MPRGQGPSQCCEGGGRANATRGGRQGLKCSATRARQRGPKPNATRARPEHNAARANLLDSGGPSAMLHGPAPSGTLRGPVSRTTRRKRCATRAGQRGPRHTYTRAKDERDATRARLQDSGDPRAMLQGPGLSVRDAASACLPDNSCLSAMLRGLVSRTTGPEPTASRGGKRGAEHNATKARPERDAARAYVPNNGDPSAML